MADTETKKKRTKAPATGEAKPGANHITDIAHEDVANNNEPPVEDLSVSDERIKRELVKFNYTDQKIQELKDTYGALVITGPDDKAGYIGVKAAWNLIRSVRTGFEKKGLELRNQFKKILTAISGEEVRLIALVTPLEEELEKKWRAIDDERDRLKKEKEEAEQKRLMTRLEELVSMGMKLENGFYQLGETISMDAATLRALPDDQYEKLKATVKTKADELADKQRLADEKAETDRLALKQKEDDLKKQQEKIDKEKGEMAQQRRELRIGKLELLGMTLIPGPPEIMAYESVRLYLTPLLDDMDAAEFANVLETTTVQIKAVKDEKAKKELIAENTRLRSLAMQALDFDLENGSFTYDDEYHEPMSIGANDLFTLSDGAWSDFIKNTGEMVLRYKNEKVAHDQQVRAEQVAKEAKEKFIAAALEPAGMKYAWSSKDFRFKNEVKELIVTWNDMLPLTDKQITAKAKAIATEIKALVKQAEKLEADRKKEKKRLDDLALNDLERFNKMIDTVREIADAIDLTNYKTEHFMNKAKVLRANLLERIEEEVQP